MSRAQLRRLQVAERLISSEQARRLTERAFLEDALASQSLDLDGFNELVEPVREQEQEKLREAAVTRQRSEIYGGGKLPARAPEAVAAEIVLTPPGSDPAEHLYERLLALAEPEPDPEPVEAGTWWDYGPEDTRWYKANWMIAVLGEDRGASLHWLELGTFEQQLQEALDTRRLTSEKIRTGTATRLEFFVYLMPDLKELRDELLPEVQARRDARARGEPMELDSARDHALEGASYLLSESPPKELFGAIRSIIAGPISPDSVDYPDWVEANRLHWILGPGNGYLLRRRLDSPEEDPAGNSP